MTRALTSNTLDSIKVGQSATVIYLQPTPNEGIDIARRLMEIGFVPGERVRRLQGGVPGGPILIKVGQSTFALRQFEASRIVIQPE